MEKKKIVIIGASCFQKALIEKSREMDVETHVFAWEQGAEAKEEADYFYPISIVEKEQILDVCSKIHPHGVVTIASDLANITVGYLAEQLGLCANNAACVQATTNKAVMRNKLKKGGVAGPDFWILDATNAMTFKATVPYPLIVKPTDRSGSRGVRRVENNQELESGIQDALAHSFEKRVIIEEWVDGQEYSCECISWEGKHHCLAITKKYTTGSPEYVEIGHLESIDLKCEKLIVQEVFRALDNLGICWGASHTEFKVNADGQIHLIEVGSRMGGDCIGSDLVRLSTGIDYVKNVILIALGEAPTLEAGGHYGAVAVKFLLGAKHRRLLCKVKQDQRLHITYQSPDIHEESPVTDSTLRSGYFIFTGDYELVRKVMEGDYEGQNL